MNQFRNWKDASADCCARGGHLLSFLDEDLQDLVKNSINRISTYEALNRSIFVLYKILQTNVGSER